LAKYEEAEGVRPDTDLFRRYWNGNGLQVPGARRPPRRTFVTRGEPAAADEMRRRIEETLRWKVTVPEYGETVALGG
jgi:hypothetical protein